MWVLCMYASCTLGLMETTVGGGVTYILTSPELGTVIIFAGRWMFLYNVLWSWCVSRFQVQSSSMFSPLCPCGFSTLVSSHRTKFLAVKLEPEVWLMMKTCIRLPGTAGLLLVNHHGKHLHRLTLLNAAQKQAVTAPSHHVWNKIG